MEKLGVLVPVEGGFGLDTRLAAKRFAQGVPEFAAVPRKNPDEEVSDRHFIPIKPEEPFAYLSRLENAYFVCRNGEIGVILK